MYELKKKLESYWRVNLLGPGPRLMKKEFTGPLSHKGWETLLYTIDDAICEDISSLYIDGICEHLAAQKIHFRAFCNGPSPLNACQSRCITHWWLPVADVCVTFGKMGQQCKLTCRQDREIVLSFWR